MKRPLLLVALLYVGGVLAGSLISLSPALLLICALALASLALVWPCGRPMLLGPLIFLTGWTNLTLRTAIISPQDLRVILGTDPHIVTVRGVLRQSPSLRAIEQGEQLTWRSLTQIELTALRPNRQSWQGASGLMAVSTPGALTNWFAGQIVEITGVAAQPKVATAEGTFDYRAYLKELGIYYVLQAASELDWKKVATPSSPPLADRFRTWACQALARGLPAEDEALRLEWALTLGWKTALTEEVSEPFVRAATYHIFAVDGLRMAIVFGIFFGLFRALRLPRWLCGLVLIPLIWFYVALTGWPASAIRATVMLTIIIIGWALKRPSDLLNSLFAAALIILIWQPQQLFQAGFQLSFFVVLCMILTLPLLRNGFQRLIAPDPWLPEALWPRWRTTCRRPILYLSDLLLTSFAAWIGSLPLVAYYFHIVTPVSTPANLVAVPLCGLVLVSNLASLLLIGWFPAAAQLFNHAGWFLMQCIGVSSHWFADWPGAYFYVQAPAWSTSALYYGILLAFLTGWMLRPKLLGCKLAGLACAIVCWGWQCWAQSSMTRLSILPVNGGSAIYFDAPGAKQDWLADCGSTNSVEFLTKPFLRGRGVNRLRCLVLTHGDLRHVGGAAIVADLFSVKQVCASPVRFRSPTYRRLLEQFQRVPEKLRRLSRDDRLGSWEVLHPDASDRFAQADDNALVLSGNLRGTRVLLLSDLGRSGQNALFERTPNLRADIVVAGLPTASEALCEGLLDAIQPRLIIISDSEYPAGERASARLQQRLAQRKVPVIYTRFAGAATIVVRPRAWEVSTMNGTRIRGHGSGQTE